MRARFSPRSSLAALIAIGAVASPLAASADPILRHQADQRGDVVVFGSTLAFDCGSGVQPPAGATASCAGQANVSDTAPDLYWLDDVANASITPTQARTSATLSLPSGSVVTYARLYWAGLKVGDQPDTNATLDWLFGPQQVITADDSWVIPYGGAHPERYYYQATGDATEFVARWGAGDFRVSDVEAMPLVGVDVDRAFSAWTLVVFYENPADELRNLALFDGLSLIDPGIGQGSASVLLDGFLVPPGFSAKMATFGYEGDAIYDGDHFTVNGVQQADGQNPSTNVFNSSRSEFGQPYSGAYDVPAFTGEPATMAGYDLDTFDVSAIFSAGDTSVDVGADSSFDVFFLAGFATSVTNLAPHFQVSKTVTDLNGGAIVPGDELEFAIVAKNDGNDEAVDVKVIDPLASGLDFVPGSLKIVSGGSNGNKTDAAGDDQGVYAAASTTVTFHVGVGATAADGGSLAPGATAEVRFRAKVTAVSGTALANQADVSASGASGAPEKTWSSDSDPNQIGAQPTPIPVDECQSDADCGGVKPHCDLETHTCQPCATDADCSDPAAPACQPDGSCKECSETNQEKCVDDTPVCNVVTGTCVLCTPENPEACEDSPDGDACVSSDGGASVHCGCETDADCGDAKSGRICDPETDKCIDGCRGEAGNNCPDGEQCTSTDSNPGTCEPIEAPGAQGDCACATPGTQRGTTTSAALSALFGLTVALAARRRRASKPSRS